MRFSKLFTTCSAIILAGIASNSYAGGFQLYEAGVSALGNAFAGTGATAEDASTEFYNPAGMTLLKHPEFTVAGTAIDLNLTTNVKSAENTTQITLPLIQPPFSAQVSAPVSGAATSHPGGWNAVPAFHFVYPWHRVAFGFGVTAPFGLQTDYTDDSMARFLATKSRLIVLNVGPNIAFQVTPKLSIGAGFDIQYADADLNQDVALIPKPIILPNPWPTIPAVDGTFNNSAHGLGYGWNAGAIYQFTPSTRVGLAYRSKVSHRLEGTATLEIPGNPIIEELASTFGHVSTNITLPDYANLSIYHDFNAKWSVMGGVDYTHWAEIQDVTLNFSGPIGASLNTISVPLDFRNTWRLSVGADYHPIPKLTLRAGTAYDESPVRGTETRTFRLPDSDRYWLALGAGYRFNSALSVDAGYSHLFAKNSHINETQVNQADFGPVEAALISSAIADVTSSVNEYGLQLNWDLDASDNSALAPPAHTMALK